MDPQQEHDLLEASRTNVDAFREIYEHYFPKIFAYVSYRLGRRQDSEDLVSVVFLKAMERLDHFKWQGEGSFAAWLFRIAHDGVVDAYRNRRKELESVALEELPDLAASALLPAEQALQKEKLASMRQAIAALSPRRQEIITLKFFGGLRNAEIAEVLGLDERTVASHLCRGLDDLHRHYLDTFFTSKER
jgi:RNA polymerase sigma-70 factor (ECF subfamily)